MLLRMVTPPGSNAVRLERVVSARCYREWLLHPGPGACTESTCESSSWSASPCVRPASSVKESTPIRPSSAGVLKVLKVSAPPS